jgi:hypothetical protein
MTEISAERRAFLQQIGGKGGAETARRYGRKYMAAIGKQGLRVYAERYHSGNRKEAWEALKLLHSGNHCPNTER